MNLLTLNTYKSVLALGDQELLKLSSEGSSINSHFLFLNIENLNLLEKENNVTNTFNKFLLLNE